MCRNCVNINRKGSRVVGSVVVSRGPLKNKLVPLLREKYCLSGSISLLLTSKEAQSSLHLSVNNSFFCSQKSLSSI